MKSTSYRFRRPRARHGLASGQTPGMQKVFVAPGNAGTAREHELENINITDPGGAG